jgi:uncharacterized protein (DUF433 family)
MTAQYPELWKDRLHVPAYSVREAARYAGTSVQTINNWQHLSGNRTGVLGHRDRGKALSYMQLIELGVVSAMRKAKVPLKAIRQARDYLATNFGSQFPFAEYRFKTSGKDLLVESEALDKSDKNKLIAVSENGQYAWKEILQQLLHEFDYSAEDNGSVVRWRVAGRERPIVIDPKLAFGRPCVDGVQTTVLRERWNSGETVDDLADDFGLDKSLVVSALRFERVDTDPNRKSSWVH